ncbi:MAG: SlyX family protein [Acidimicrobiia bacterium]|nr:SlyX family protein [Acidimicrobiia bacterium]
MQQDTLRTIIQAATLAIVAVGALAGLGVWAINAIVAQEVRPLQEKVATLEQQSAAIVQLQTDVAALRRDVEWIREALKRMESAAAGSSPTAPN